MDNELEQKLTGLHTDLKGYMDKAAEEKKSLGTALDETKSTIGTILAKLDAEELKAAEHLQRTGQLQTQVDAIDKRLQSRSGGDEPQFKTLGQQVTEDPKFIEAKGFEFRGKANLNIPLVSSAFPTSVKSNITTTGIGGQTTGVMPLQRLPGISIIAQQELRIRDLMNVVTMTTGNSFDYVVQNTRTNAPSPQVEASPKSESTYNWTSASGTIKTIAHFTNVSKQALSDVPWLRNMIDSELTYGLKVKEEAEILSGDGTGAHLNGIITQATAFNTALLSASQGWTNIDQVRYAKLQVRLAGLATFAPNGIVLHPTDMAHIELTKDGFGLYIVGSVKDGTAVKYLWGLPVVESDSIASGTFLVGAFDTAAQLIDRMAASVDLSYEHASNFTSNLCTILVEERIGLAVNRPTAFCTGTFSRSPA